MAGLEFSQAAAISLVGVLATSASVSASTRGRRLLNTRLALLLLAFSVSGAVAGVWTVKLVPSDVLELVFGGTALAAAGGAPRSNVRNVRFDAGLVRERLGPVPRCRHGEHVVYAVRRLPLAMLVSSAPACSYGSAWAGASSSFRAQLVVRGADACRGGRERLHDWRHGGARRHRHWAHGDRGLLHGGADRDRRCRGVSNRAWLSRRAPVR
jgi:hypothetical protein